MRVRIRKKKIFIHKMRHWSYEQFTHLLLCSRTHIKRCSYFHASPEDWENVKLYDSLPCMIFWKKPGMDLIDNSTVGWAAILPCPSSIHLSEQPLCKWHHSPYIYTAGELYKNGDQNCFSLRHILKCKSLRIYTCITAVPVLKSKFIFYIA